MNKEARMDLLETIEFYERVCEVLDTDPGCYEYSDLVDLIHGANHALQIFKDELNK